MIFEWIQLAWICDPLPLVISVCDVGFALFVGPKPIRIWTNTRISVQTVPMKIAPAFVGV